MVRLVATRQYEDLQLHRVVSVGEVLEVDEDRALVLLATGFVELTDIVNFKQKKNAKNSTRKKRV